MQTIKKVLAINNNQRQLKVLEKLIKISFSSIETITTTSGAKGLELVQKEKPNVILLDIILPGEDGFEICKTLKQNPETSPVPVVFLSSVDYNEENRLKAIEAGADAFLKKPVNKLDLALQLKAMLKINESNLREKSEMQRLEKLVQEKTVDLKNELKKRTKIQEKLKESEKKLKELNATKDKFFSIIAHDLRSPLSAVIGMSNLIYERSLENNYTDIVKLAGLSKKSAYQCFDLLNNLLEWSHAQSGRKEFKPVKLKLCDVGEEMINLFDLSAREKAIAIQIDCPENIAVYADKNMLKTIIRNLISNALKYTNSGGKIRLSAKRKGQNIELCVKDNGLGMDNIQKSKLFKIGENVSTPGIQNEKGTGLGLILCKEFVEMHGGTITVDSQKGKGSTFFFTIPAA